MSGLGLRLQGEGLTMGKGLTMGGKCCGCGMAYNDKFLFQNQSL